MSHDEAVLEVAGLKVRYGRIEAIHGIDLKVYPGEVVSIIGANGAGKTSTLLTISGVIRAAEGTIKYMGSEIQSLSAHKIASMRIAHVPEGRRIFPQMTVWENLVIGTYSRGTLPDKRDTEHVFTLFPVLKQRLSQLGGTLSGGEQQMLAIGRALVSRPRLLLLDEPSMGLAPKLVSQIFDLIGTINSSGVTMLLVEQNARMALKVSERAYVLETGNVTMENVSSVLATDEKVKKAYLGG